MAREIAEFREALGRHLLAIEKRDLAALAATVAPDTLVLVSAEGRLVRSTAEFLELHRAWFAMPGWTLHAKPVQFVESPQLCVAVFDLDYREAGKRQESLLTLVFELREGRWLMVLDQNTPRK
jgi:ketosteroid isomerase-like protein